MRSCLLFLSVLLHLPGITQQREIDSLQYLLKRHSTGDTTRLKLLSDLSFIYYQADPAKGLSYANEMIMLAKKINDTGWLGMGYARKGLNYYEQGEAGPALEHYKLAETIFAKQNNKERLFGIRNSIAILYTEISEFPTALDLYFKNLRYCENEKKDKGIALTCGNIALVYRRMDNNKQALQFNQRAIDIQTKLNNERALTDLLNAQGNTYDNMEEPVKAIPYYRKSIALAKKLDYPKGVASASSNLGNVFNEVGMYDSAIAYIKNSIPFYQQAGDKSNLAVLYQYMGNIILKATGPVLLKESIAPEKRFVAANNYFLKSLELNKVTEDVAAQAENWQSISQVLKQMGSYKEAAEASEKYAALKDSLFNDEKLEAVKQAELHYAVKKNEDSLVLIQEGKNMAARAEISRQKTLQRSLMIGSGAVLLASIVSFIFYKKRRDARQKQKEAEFKKDVAETEMKALRSQMNPHFIFNSLNSIGDYISKNNVNEADRYLSKFAKLMRMILENSEQKDVTIADDLKALELYMQLEALRMNQKFNYEIKVDEDIDQENTLIPPLILQPFVENSIWHGIAQKEGQGKINIHIKKENDSMLNCIVEDNGIGRKQSAAVKTTTLKQEKTSLGMKITQARIDILNRIKNSDAAVNLSDLDQGVRVEVKLPLYTAY